MEAGIIEEVKPHLQESIPSKEPIACRTHHLSHHGVVREEALTTKLRIVFYGSAKVKPDTPSLRLGLYVELLPHQTKYSSVWKRHGRKAF